MRKKLLKGYAFLMQHCHAGIPVINKTALWIIVMIELCMTFICLEFKDSAVDFACFNIVEHVEFPLQICPGNWFDNISEFYQILVDYH